jgi:uronate dehydrogenase
LPPDAGAPRPLLLTGAAGRIGGWLRPLLAPRPGGLRSFDIRPIVDALPGESTIVGDLADLDAVERAVDGAAAVLHFGAVSVEDGFEPILRANIVGTYNVFEAARRRGVERVVYASSIHTVGFCPTAQTIDADAPPRPDSLYGVSKCFGENLARLYVEKAGLRVACLRIGVAAPAPTTPRNLWTWLSVDDLLRLIDAALAAPELRFSVVYGISDNRRRWWDNARAGVDYRPRDDAERFAATLMPDGDRRDPDDPGVRFHGGPFVALAIGERPA